jgi:iron complex transport system substrate-binding protein
MARTSTRIGAAAFAAVVALAACGGDADGGGDDGAASADDGDGASSGWTYTDGSGTETTLDDVPTRIVAHSTSAAALMSFGITPVGIYADTTVEDELTLQGVDLDGIEIVGEEWGEINVEAVAALDPDIIVSEWWPVEQGYTGMEPGAGTGLETMQEIAPVVGVAQSTSIVGMIEDYAELAESLGVDLDEPDVAASREAFDDAVASFEAAVEAQPDLSVLAVSPTEESLYVAVPEHSAELSDFTDWGLGLVVPDSPDEGFEYWETLSWENADKYQADLLIVDERGYPANVDDAEAQPTWDSLEAAAADAVAVWPAYWVRTYDAYAGALEDLTEAVESADPDLVP